MSTAPVMSVFTELYPAPDFGDSAACADGNPTTARLFFDIRGESYSERLTRQRTAEEVCHTCPVRKTCGDYAFKYDIPDGIWGGYTQEARGYSRSGRPRKNGPTYRTHDIDGIGA